LSVIEKERATALMLVGDAFGRPILEEIQRGNYDLSCIKIIMNNGAILNHPVKVALLEMLPAAKIVDNMGASETGSQGVKISTLEGITSKNSADATNFKLSADNVVLSEDLQKVLEKGHDGTGWLAKKVHVPLGYLDDREKTQSTFPEVDGQRYAVPGDKVQLKEDGNILFFGRDSGTINSGGEKIFAEEVERALKYHPSVFDAVVAGRRSERWGNEVVAVVQLRKSSPFDKNSILDECGKHIARYKLPKAFSIVATIKRSPSGKADYRWAKREAEKAS
jgi:acyl-CoA synthetase (AMP-forming)/AMP-acid ligase II